MWSQHRMVINRITTNAMEPRGCLAEYDQRDDRYTLRCTVQGPHIIRRALSSEVLKLPETQVRVISENVGGGFGMKGALYNEYILCVVAAKITGQPVKWISERSEGLLSDEQARDNVTEAELALDNNGKILGLRVKTFANIGAYYHSDRSAGPPTVNVGVLAGTYAIPAAHVEVTGVLTNTMLTGPYRGAGRPEAAYVIETMVDLAARKLGLDPAELRRRNTIPAAAMPYKTALVYTYDCGDFGKNLEDCLIKADHAGFAARYRQSRQHGKLRGIGISNTVEVIECRPDRARRDSLRPDRHRDHPGRLARSWTGSPNGVAPDHRRPSSGSIRARSASNGATPTRSRSAPAPSVLVLRYHAAAR